MKHGRTISAVCVAISILACAPAARAADGAALQGGAYEVEFRLELPHLDAMTATRTIRVCLSEDRGADDHGLAVLSENNPLARCPVSNVRQDEDELTFDIVCEGRNQAKASARYTLSSGRFRGRFIMQMGGKNMTMTEVQAGHRLGDCTPGSTPSL